MRKCQREQNFVERPKEDETLVAFGEAKLSWFDTKLLKMAETFDSEVTLLLDFGFLSLNFYIF